MRRMNTLMVCFALAASPASADTSRELLREQFERSIQAIATEIDGVIGLTLEDLGTGEQYSLNGDVVFTQASAIKLPILIELFRQVEQWQTLGFAPVRERWMTHALPVGTQMRVKLPDGDVLGRFSGIDERGSLLLGSNGESRRIDMGDVFALPATNERAD